MAAVLWSGAPFSLKTDAQLQLLHRFESSGLVLAIYFTCENQVHKTELRVKKMFYMESTSEVVPGGEVYLSWEPSGMLQEVSIFQFISFFEVVLSY